MVINKLKVIGAYLLTLVLTIVTLGGYAYHQKRKADEYEREHEQLLIENQGLIKYGQRLEDAHGENAKQQIQVEEDLLNGKRDHFERSDW